MLNHLVSGSQRSSCNIEHLDELELLEIPKLIGRMERAAYALVRQGQSNSANSLFYAVASLEQCGSKKEQSNID